jgi:hypothetical protein
VPSIGELMSAEGRQRLLERLAALAAEEAAKPPAIPAAKFKPPPGPGDGEPPTEQEQ